MQQNELTENEVDESDQWYQYKVVAVLEYSSDGATGTACTDVETGWLYECDRAKRIAEELQDRDFSVNVRVRKYASFGGGYLDDLPEHPG